MPSRVSSNATMFLRIFIPTAWITFFGMFTIAILISSGERLPMGGGWDVKLGILFFFLLFLAGIYFTLMKLYRVEFGKDGVYVSNYLKTYRYKYIDLENIIEKNFGLFKTGTLVLKQKGKFGKKITFLISKIHYEDYIRENPSTFEHLL